MKRKKRDVNNRKENESSNIFTKFAKKNNNPPREIERLSTADKYRAPSMTEMMLLCCKFGCSFRDIVPTCNFLWTMGQLKKIQKKFFLKCFLVVLKFCKNQFFGLLFFYLIIF
uniref:Uncharacterized protein n=1 Tax=Meloidogyne enterolobii TaxID=390850 RepID=A0A6V7U6V8_MELEN|nr:unnamed protein product [Meloidogyne enterolobii]